MNRLWIGLLEVHVLGTVLDLSIRDPSLEALVHRASFLLQKSKSHSSTDSEILLLVVHPTFYSLSFQGHLTMQPLHLHFKKQKGEKAKDLGSKVALYTA